MHNRQNKDLMTAALFTAVSTVTIISKHREMAYSTYVDYVGQSIMVSMSYVMQYMTKRKHFMVCPVV